MTRAYVGMGSNVGDRVMQLADALDALEADPRVRVIAVSSVYETEPWGVADQPPFANAVAVLDVDLAAAELLSLFKRVEAGAGRVAGVPNGPRPLDLDLLLFGSETIATPDLTVPHPRMFERDFVVTPLLEVAPAATRPGGSPILREVATEGRVTGVIAGDLRSASRGAAGDTLHGRATGGL